MPNNIIDISIFQSTIRMATPVMLAAMGALLTGAAGIINIGLEGMMLLSAFFSVVGSYYFGSAWVGMLTGMLSGVAIAAVFGIFP